MTEQHDGEPKKPQDWQQIQDDVRAAWQAEPESQKGSGNLLAPKEITVRHRAWPWIVRGLIGLLALTVIFGVLVMAEQNRTTRVQQTLPTFEAGPPLRLLPTPPVVGGQQGAAGTPTPEPTLRPEDYRVFPATPPAGTPTPG